MKWFIVAAAVLAAAPAAAGSLAFSGTFLNTNAPAAPGGRCAALTVSIRNAAPFYAHGTSTAGDFTSSQSHCLNSGPPVAPGSSPVPYSDGIFTYTFDRGTLSGTYAGLLTNGGTAGVIDNAQDFVVTGGTGRFAGASGSFSGTGGIRFVPGAPPAATLDFNGRLFAPGVPEPATWSLLCRRLPGGRRRRAPASGRGRSLALSGPHPTTGAFTASNGGNLIPRTGRRSRPR